MDVNLIFMLTVLLYLQISICQAVPDRVRIKILFSVNRQPLRIQDTPIDQVRHHPEMQQHYKDLPSQEKSPGRMRW